MTQIKRLHIKGFRSLADVEITDMPRTAVMIGPNGSGKSNVIDFFVMVHRMLKSGKLNDFVRRNGGASDQLFGGSNTTRHMEAHIVIGAGKGTAEYAFKLACGHPDRFVFVDERYRSAPDGSAGELSWEHLGSGHGEAKIREACAEEQAAQLGVSRQAARTVSDLLRNMAAYQFHDTFFDSWFMKTCDTTDDAQLGSHGGNLAAVLHKLEHDDPDRYGAICEHIKRILPIFDGFALEERHGTIALQWRHAQGGQIVGAHLTSGGSLLFVLDLRQGKTEITRHQRADYEHWLTEYSLGQLWQKNLLGGRP